MMETLGGSSMNSAIEEWGWESIRIMHVEYMMKMRCRGWGWGIEDEDVVYRMRMKIDVDEV